jgi:hypothetical protein
MAKKQKSSPFKTAVKVAAGVGAAALATYGVAKGVQYLKGKKRSKGRRRSAAWYARQILRLRLKKKYDKLKVGV